MSDAQHTYNTPDPTTVAALNALSKNAYALLRKIGDLRDAWGLAVPETYEDAIAALPPAEDNSPLVLATLPRAGLLAAFRALAAKKGLPRLIQARRPYRRDARIPTEVLRERVRAGLDGADISTVLHH